MAEPFLAGDASHAYHGMLSFFWLAVTGESALVQLIVAASTDFAFTLSRPIVPATQQQAHPVVWRGLLKERHPDMGLVQRVPVYRLDDGYWDCYREEELQAT